MKAKWNDDISILEIWSLWRAIHHHTICLPSHVPHHQNHRHHHPQNNKLYHGHCIDKSVMVLRSRLFSVYVYLNMYMFMYVLLCLMPHLPMCIQKHVCEFGYTYSIVYGKCEIHPIFLCYPHMPVDILDTLPLRVYLWYIDYIIIDPLGLFL